MLFSAFSPFGMFAFSGQLPLAQRIYTSLKAGIDPKAFDLTAGTLEEARIYSLAMGLARARSTLQRADNQRIPTKAIEKLPSLERDFGITPGGSDTVTQRQNVVAAAKAIQNGSREGAVVAALQALLGTDFVAYRVTPANLVKTWPPTPSAVGTYKLTSQPKFFTTLGCILPGSYQVQISYLNNSQAPQVGEQVTVEPETSSVTENVTITALARSSGSIQLPDLLTATFVNPHTIGAKILTGPYAIYQSTQREVNVIVSATAAKNKETRRKINKLMARALKATARWEIMAATSATQVGPDTIGVGNNILGATALGSSAYTF